MVLLDQARRALGVQPKWWGRKLHPKEMDWVDGTELTIGGVGLSGGASPYCRLPETLKGKVPPAVWDMSHQSTGVFVQFVPHSERIMLNWKVKDPRASDAYIPAAGVMGLDVYRQDETGAWRFVVCPHYYAFGKDQPGLYEMKWEPGRPCRVYLPLRSWVERFRVGVEKGQKIEPLPTAGVARRIVHYGTSIVHGGCVSRPGLAFATQAGRAADVEVINHGYSGAGRMEMSLCEVVASIEAALYVIDCDWNMDVPLQQAHYEPFVRELRRRRPKTPILLCGGCTQHETPREQEVYARRIFDKLKAEDPVLWSNMDFISGVDMLPKDDACTFDYCHPNDYGAAQMGRVYAEAIRKLLGADSK